MNFESALSLFKSQYQKALKNYTPLPPVHVVIARNFFDDAKPLSLAAIDTDKDRALQKAYGRVDENTICRAFNIVQMDFMSRIFTWLLDMRIPTNYADDWMKLFARELRELLETHRKDLFPEK